MADGIFSEPFYVQIPLMRVAKDVQISANPEEEVIARLQEWVKARGVDVDQSRAFGFDVPVNPEQAAQGLRGYEYWIQVPPVVPAKAGTSSITEKVPRQARDDNNVIPMEAGTQFPRIEPFPGGRYIALRITEPFADPFDRIPRGWQTLVKYIQDSRPSLDGGHVGGNPNNDINCNAPGSCLEEVQIIDGVCCMDVMIVIYMDLS
jgi:AraC family transcriptional regulator